MRTLLVAGLAALAFAAPAQAQLAPPPTLIDFQALQTDEEGAVDGAVYPGVNFSTGPCGSGSATPRMVAAPEFCLFIDEGGDGGQALGYTTDTLNINGGVFDFGADAANDTASLNVVVAAGATAHFNATQHLNDLTINGGSADLSAGLAKKIVTRGLNVTGGGKLNLHRFSHGHQAR